MHTISRSPFCQQIEDHQHYLRDRDKSPSLISWAHGNDSSGISLPVKRANQHGNTGNMNNQTVLIDSWGQNYPTLENKHKNILIVRILAQSHCRIPSGGNACVLSWSSSTKPTAYASRNWINYLIAIAA